VRNLPAAESAAPPQLREVRAQLARVADGLPGAVDGRPAELSGGIHRRFCRLGPAFKTLAGRSAVSVALHVHV
jgi:hypothetical protein